MMLFVKSFGEKPRYENGYGYKAQKWSKEKRESLINNHRLQICNHGLKWLFWNKRIEKDDKIIIPLHLTYEGYLLSQLIGSKNKALRNQLGYSFRIATEDSRFKNKKIYMVFVDIPTLLETYKFTRYELDFVFYHEIGHIVDKDRIINEELTDEEYLRNEEYADEYAAKALCYKYLALGEKIDHYKVTISALTKLLETKREIIEKPQLLEHRIENLKAIDLKIQLRKRMKMGKLISNDDNE